MPADPDLVGMADTPTIGFIGLGIMGTPAAKNLLDAGYDLVVNDLSDERVEGVTSYGAEAAPTPAAVAERADVVLTFLPEGDHVKAVALGEDGLIEGADDALVYVDMGTVGPAAIREVAAELEAVGVHVIDAPVSGGEAGSKAGSLRIMFGSDDPIPPEVEAIFEVLGDHVTRIGELGAGQVAKVCNNMVGASSIVALAEALVFAEKAGVSKERIVEAMHGGTAQTWMLDNRAHAMIDHDFEPGFFSSYLYKDLRIGINDAQEYGAPVPLASVDHELFKTVEARGRGDLDTAAIITVMEEMAGIDPDV